MNPYAAETCAVSVASANDRPFDAGVVKAGGHDLEYLPIRFPSPRVLETLGEAGLRRLVRCHHEALLQSSVRHLFPGDAETLAKVVEKSALFFIESCGGAPDYTRRHGGNCMRTQHFPFTIDEAARDVWLACLRQAFDLADTPSAAREELWGWLESMSVRMINRRTTKKQPTRHAYASSEKQS
jgi:hemoglobin